MKKNYGLLVFVSVLFCAAVAFAADPKAPAETGFSLASINMSAILNGAVAGLVAALLGWLKNVDPKTGQREAWDMKSGAITIGLGAIIGAYAGWQNKELSVVATYLETAPWVLTVELVLKSVLRNTPVALRPVIGYLKNAVNTNPTPQAPVKP